MLEHGAKGSGGGEERESCRNEQKRCCCFLSFFQAIGGNQSCLQIRQRCCPRLFITKNTIKSENMISEQHCVFNQAKAFKIAPS